jgi:hypothetical protein
MIEDLNFEVGKCIRGRGIAFSATMLILMLVIWSDGHAQGRGPFSIPYRDLAKWSKQIIIGMPHFHLDTCSQIHRVSEDCEIHLVGTSDDFSGVPDTLVLEPMNSCSKVLFDTSKYHAPDWNTIFQELERNYVSVEGVPRIWPEHLANSGKPTSPCHAFELHPLTRLQKGGDIPIEFADLISYPGHIETSNSVLIPSILGRTTVDVAARGDQVLILFHGNILNFAELTLRFRTEDIVSDPDSKGHRIEGEVLSDSAYQIHMISVAGSSIDSMLDRLGHDSSQTVTLSALVLFSLWPKALLDAADKSTNDDGEWISAQHPLQLILYGEVQPSDPAKVKRKALDGTRSTRNRTK